MISGPVITWRADRSIDRYTAALTEHWRLLEEVAGAIGHRDRRYAREGLAHHKAEVRCIPRHGFRWVRGRRSAEPLGHRERSRHDALYH